jgi:hypothetical protein
MSKLGQLGLASLPGKLLYSGISTLSPGELYVLGHNPGGDPLVETTSVADDYASLAGRPRGWNEYLDASWRPGGREQSPGGAIMQKRVCNLIASFGLEIRAVCASNLIFVRSRDMETLEGQEQLAQRCWPIHRFILENVRPRAILSIGGNRVFDFVRSQARDQSAVEEFPSGHGTWTCKAMTGQVGQLCVSIVSVPHLSRYAVDRHPRVIDWVRAKSRL